MKGMVILPHPASPRNPLAYDSKARSTLTGRLSPAPAPRRGDVDHSPWEWHLPERTLPASTRLLPRPGTAIATSTWMS